MSDNQGYKIIAGSREISGPAIMGVLNLTPDSFSDGGKFNRMDTALGHVDAMLSAGAAIIDIGGYSSRPGAPDISPDEELSRVHDITLEILRTFPQAILSLDTFRASVARPLLDAGVRVLNDITAGRDPEMFPLVARAGASMILMHIQGTPQTMQVAPAYQNVSEEVRIFLQSRAASALAAGVHAIWLDPGFGFGKTLEHNYELFGNLATLSHPDMPLVAGISRKSMIRRLLKPLPETPDDPRMAEITAALHLKALEAGVQVLRVHDVEAAARVITLFKALHHGSV